MARVAFSNAAWDRARAARGKTPEQYCGLCLIDLNPPGRKKLKTRCKCPIRYTPGGAVIKAALRAVSAALAGARDGLKGVPAAKRRAAARRTLSLMRRAKMTPGPSLRRIAGSK